MKKFLSVLTGVLVILVLFATNAESYEGSSADQSERQVVQEIQQEKMQVSITINGRTINTVTNASDVQEFLYENDITLNERDRIIPRIETEITEGLHIEITRAFHVFIRIDGNENLVAFTARPGSFVSMLVSDFRNHTGNEFMLADENWHRRVEEGDIVELHSVRRIVKDEYQPIAFDNELIETDELLWGTMEVYQPGVPGSVRVTTEVVYIGGLEESNEVISEEIILQPENAVVLIGTLLPPLHALSSCGEVFTYRRNLVMEATAYTLDFASTGRHPDHPLFGVTASGMQAQVGVVAVDTNVIPFHTRLYIEGYGFAVAGDRGGAIRGEKVDLFFDTRTEALQFGRQHLRVWILD